MKKILLLTAVCALLCILCMAAEPGYVFAPYEAEPVKGMTFSQNAIFEYEDTYAVYTTYHGVDEGGAGDPYMSVPSADFDSKYEWIKLRIRNLSDATHFEMHFASDGTGGGITGSSCTRLPISSNDEDFKEYVFNMNEYNSKTNNGAQSVWSGNVKTVRFDCLWKDGSGKMNTGDSMYIDYIAFFETEEDAKAYGGAVKDKKPVTPDESWDKDSPHFIFDTEADLVPWTAGANTKRKLEYGNMRVMVFNNDPMVYSYLAEDEYFNAQDYPYFAYRYKAKANVTQGGIFFDTTTHRSTADNWTPFNMAVRGKWANIVMDMREAAHGNWEGDVTYIRIDPFHQYYDKNSLIYIDRLGFFKTEAQAKAFIAEGGSEDFSSTEYISGDLYKAIIPAGVLTENFNKSDYTLNTASPSDNGTSPVVIRTNADGSRDTVALSYTNSNGHTTYVANKPGNYTLGYNHKEYSDIAGHWGENYINFVSDRTLFGGTSPTEFSPDMTMTRGMFITVLGRMHGLDIASFEGDTGYSDVNPDMYYAPYINWAKKDGIMSGVSESAFAPEEAITREDMAVVIRNYIRNSGYVFNNYNKETIEFTDLGDCSEDTASAINEVKNAGIVGGKGDGKFDPKGISTRAEVATVMERVIKAVLEVNVPNTEYDAQYFTRDRIRIGVWDFPSTLVNEQGMKDLYELGVDLVVNGSATTASPAKERLLSYADVYGIEVFLSDYFVDRWPSFKDDTDFIDSVDPQIVSAGYSHHPSFGGHYITDEPGSEAMDVLASIINDYQAQMPGKRAFVNLLPMYANDAQLYYGNTFGHVDYTDDDPDVYRKYCQTWFKGNDADYICADIYPLNWTGTLKTTYAQYIESINQIATVAREEGKDFWSCIQTFGWTPQKRTPNEAEFRWQCYSMLSFGCKTIILWNYTGYSNFPSVINGDTLQKTATYDDCKTVMWEMRELSDTYIQYKNLGAFTHRSQQAPYLQMSGEYTGFDTIKSVDCEQPLLLGCFEKKDGSGTAFTVVNMAEFYSEKSAQVKITLSDPIKTVTLYNRAQPTVLTPENGVITIDLENGDGVFVTID